MRVSFFASKNSRFILGLEGREIFLYKDQRELWKREISYNNFEVIGVGNNGNVFVKADEGILIYPPRAHDTELMIPVFKREILHHENAGLAKMFVDSSGNRLCVEKITLKSKLSEKLFKILSSSPKVERGQAMHELILYDLVSGKQKIFYKFTVDRKIPHSFTWCISSDFRYIIWGEAQKVFKGTETKFAAADVREESVYDQFILEGLTEWVLLINTHGSYLIDSPQRREKRELLIGDINANNFRISISNEFRPIHIGKNFVAFRSRMQPRMFFKRFNDAAIQDVDLTSLEEMELDYDILFNERDDIDFIARKDGELKVIHTNMEQLSVDARRWEIMAEQQKIDEEIEKKKSILEEKQKSLKEKRRMIITNELTRTARKSKKSRKRKDYKTVELKERELEILKAQYDSKRIGKYDYLKKRIGLEKEIDELKAGPAGKTTIKTRKFTPDGTKKLVAPKTDKIPPLADILDP